MSRSELNPRGPKSAISRLSRPVTCALVRTGYNTIVRAKSAITTKTIVGKSMTERPVQISEVPSATKVRSKSISAVASPYSRKQSHSSTSCELDHEAGRECGEESAASNALRECKCTQRQADRVKRFIVAPHREPIADLLEQDDAKPSDKPTQRGTQQKQADDAASDSASGRRRTEGEHRENHDREQHDVVHSRFDSQGNARNRWKCAESQHAAKQNRIGRCESSADYRGSGPGKSEQHVACDCNHDRRSDRPRTEQSPEQRPPQFDFGDVDRDGITEQHQCESQHRERVERRRVESDVDEPETEWAEHGAKREKDRDDGESAFLEHSGKE